MPWRRFLLVLSVSLAGCGAGAACLPGGEAGLQLRLVAVGDALAPGTYGVEASTAAYAHALECTVLAGVASCGEGAREPGHTLYLAPFPDDHDPEGLELEWTETREGGLGGPALALIRVTLDDVVVLDTMLEPDYDSRRECGTWDHALEELELGP